MKSVQRQRLEKVMLEGMAQILTREQMRVTREFLDSLSEEDYLMFVAEARRHAVNMTAKEYFRGIKQMAVAQGLNHENSGMNEVELKVLAKEDAARVWADIQKTQPSDHIRLTAGEDKALIDLWEKGEMVPGIPSDLFFAGTVPLKDCRITVDERDQENGTVCRYRVVIFEDYEERIRTSEDDGPVMVGAVVPEYVTGNHLFIPIMVVPGFDNILMGFVGYEVYNEGVIKRAKKHTSMADMGRMMKALLETWYGIQIALLHPTVRDVFRHPRKEKDRESLQAKRPGQKRAVRYIKVHVINKDDLEKAMYGDGQKRYSRRALVWYVIGHWRTLANGAKSFVKPYWKGPLRDLKMAFPERDREIVIGGSC